MTPFEEIQQQAEVNGLELPKVSYGDKKVGFFSFQLATHRFNLRLMAKGMTFRSIKFTDIKRYYGLKGRSAKDCLEQFDKIIADYKAKLEKEREQSILN